MNEFEYNLKEQEERRMRHRIYANAERPHFVIRSFDVTSSWEPLQIEGQFIDGNYFYYRYRDGSLYMEVNRQPLDDTIYFERKNVFFGMNDLSLNDALNHIRRFWSRFDRQNEEE